MAGSKFRNTVCFLCVCGERSMCIVNSITCRFVEQRGTALQRTGGVLQSHFIRVQTEVVR